MLNSVLTEAWQINADDPLALTYLLGLPEFTVTRLEYHDHLDMLLVFCSPLDQVGADRSVHMDEAPTACPNHQQRHILHTASERLADFVRQQGVAKLAIGDVRDIADGTGKGRKTNRKLSQWARPV